MTSWNIDERPNRIPWPPLLLVGFIVAGFLLRAVFPIEISRTMPWQVGGFVLIAVALALDVWASLTFTRARTTILPHRGSDALVTHGPFAYSRNPIYVGNLMILAGVGLLAGSPWHVILVPALALAIAHFAIRREEAHLASRFPGDWADYSSRVRRWI